MPDAVYDCQTCGACCAAAPAMTGYVRLHDIDLERLRRTDLPILRQEDQWSDWTEEVYRLGTKVDAAGQRVCAGFAGEVGGVCSCSVYEQRPQACRYLEPGTFACREARRQAKILE